MFKPIGNKIMLTPVVKVEKERKTAGGIIMLDMDQSTQPDPFYTIVSMGEDCSDRLTINDVVMVSRADALGTKIVKDPESGITYLFATEANITALIEQD